MYKPLLIIGVAALLVGVFSGCMDIGYAYYNYEFYDQIVEDYTRVSARIKVVNNGYTKGVDTHPVWWYLLVNAVEYEFYDYDYDSTVISPGEEAIFTIIYRIPDTIDIVNRSIYYDKSADREYVIYNATLEVK
jgi:hypothetical protein